MLSKICLLKDMLMYGDKEKQQQTTGVTMNQAAAAAANALLQQHGYTFSRSLDTTSPLGSVHVVVDVVTGKERILKCNTKNIDKLQRVYPGRLLDDLKSESKMMDYVQKKFDCDDLPIMAKTACFEDVNNVYLVMDKAEIDLFDLLERKSHLPQKRELLPSGLSVQEASFIIKGVMEVVQRLHSCGIAHRDISLENVVFDSRCSKMKIIDLGCAEVLDTSLEHHYPASLSRPVVGKLPYMAPEVLDNKIPYNAFKGDAYTLGPIITSVVFGTFSYDFPRIDDPGFRKVVLEQRLGELYATYMHRRTEECFLFMTKCSTIAQGFLRYEKNRITIEQAIAFMNT